ncbi:MAG: 3-isopropylmalate dehydrogenase [Pirellulaceae bacterium]|nr:MAG: 3-isopropylmalate dehydrogenase [Pirellulaceae bacterium]GIW92580.1 MAG: 3-isopropylmalate dehydrogenase [Pirellulaceae bacterium]
MHVFRIAVLPGDGIGPEVMGEAVRVLQRLEGDWTEAKLELSYHEAGAATYQKCGQPLPPETLEACRQADAVLLGAMGLPSVRWPDGREVTPQVDLREELDLYCGLRPVRLWDPAASPLRSERLKSIDILLIRESTEGLFWARRESQRCAEEVRDVMRISRTGSERLFHAAFLWARRRCGRVTLVDKANVLPAMAFFRQVFFDVAQQYPDVETECLYVDAAALHMVLRPESFDVMVTENMFGDILSDLGAALVGGMGLAPSADVGERHAVFQPAHGSAPDIAGKQIANPLAMILSAGMMLTWLGHPETVAAAQRLEQAVRHALAHSAERTPDLGGRLRTTQMTDLVLRALDTVESQAG